MTEEEWKALLDKLYTELHIHEWNSIFITRNYAEGEKWELEILFTEDRVIKYKGFGGFPPYWEELKELLRGLETGGLQ